MFCHNSLSRRFLQHTHSVVTKRITTAAAPSGPGRKYFSATGVTISACAMGVCLLQRNYRANTDSPLPLGSKVIVVGAGIAGVATARELARVGYHVQLIDEREGPGEGCSGGNAGTLGISAPARRISTPPFFYKAPAWLMRAPTSDGPHENNRFCHRSTFLDPYFWLWGISYVRLLLSHKQDGIPFQKDWLRRNADERKALGLAAEEEGINAFTVSGRLIPAFGAPVAGSYAASAVEGEKFESATCLKYEPCLKEAVEQGLITEGHWFKIDGHGDCKLYLRKLATAMHSKYGVKISFGAHCTRLLIEKGRCVGLELNDGTKILADAVVLANGSGVAKLAASVGVYVPVQALRGYSFTIPVRKDATAPVPQGSIVTQPHEMYISRVEDADLGDCVRFAAYGELAANWLSEPTPEMLERLEKLVKHCVPRVEEMVEWPQRRAWVGARPLSPDSNPLVGPTRVSGLYLNVGHSFNGWRLGTITGLLCANGLVRGWRANGRYDLLYSPQRFLPWRREASPFHDELPELQALRPPPAQG